jgi:hypothetical protein
MEPGENGILCLAGSFRSPEDNLTSSTCINILALEFGI